MNFFSDILPCMDFFCFLSITRRYTQPDICDAQMTDNKCVFDFIRTSGILITINKLYIYVCCIVLF